MNQEEFEGMLRYIDHAIDDDRKIYRQVMKGREYEAEMIEKAITTLNGFVKPEMDFSGEQVKSLLKYIYNVPFSS